MKGKAALGLTFAVASVFGGPGHALAVDGYTLSTTPPPSLTVGQPGIFQAGGSNPPDDFFTSWLDVAAIPVSVLTHCPADYLNANQIARSSYAQGGDVVVTAQRENVDEAGNFSLPFAFTPTVGGRFLVCGYTNDGATATLATSFVTVDVASAAPSAGPSPTRGIARPANVRKPRIARSGRRLICRKGTWSNRPSRYSYAWLVNGRRKRGATGRTLAVTRRLRGGRLQCRVRAANSGGVATAVSRRMRVR